MKNKFNKKGFTLIELLAVLVVLVTILLIAIPSITSTLERNKEKDKQQKMKIIESAGETYFSIYKNECSTGCDITIDKLKNKNLLSDSEAKDTDGKDIDVIVRCSNSGNCKVINGKTCCDESTGVCEFKEDETSC